MGDALSDVTSSRLPQLFAWYVSIEDQVRTRAFPGFVDVVEGFRPKDELYIRERLFPLVSNPRLLPAPNGLRLYYGRDARHVDELVDIARRLLGGEVAPAEEEGAVARMGILHGYPECCSRAFAADPAAVREIKEWSHVMRRTASPGAVSWELHPHCCVRFIPCSLECAHALNWAHTVLEVNCSRMGQALGAVWKAAFSNPALLFLNRTQHFVELIPEEAPAGEFAYRAGMAAGNEPGLRLVAEGDRIVIEPPAVDILKDGALIHRFDGTAFVWWHEKVFGLDYWQRWIASLADGSPWPWSPGIVSPDSGQGKGFGTAPAPSPAANGCALPQSGAAPAGTEGLPSDQVSGRAAGLQKGLPGHLEAGLSESEVMAERAVLIQDILKHEGWIAESMLSGPMTLPGSAFREHLVAYGEDKRAGRLVDGGTCLYIHIPLCTSRCLFCNCSTVRMASPAQRDTYLKILLTELEQLGKILDGIEITALAMGGGSPSILTEAQLEQLLGTIKDSFIKAPEFTMTVELTPRHVTREMARVLQAQGVDRVSLGIQSLTRSVLKAIGRGWQSHEMVSAAIRTLKDAGIRVVNLDLVAGLANETEASFRDTLLRTVALKPHALNVYLFNTFGTFLKSYNLEPDDRAKRLRDRLFDMTAEFLESEYQGVLHSPRALSVPLVDDRETQNQYELTHMLKSASVIGAGCHAQTHLFGRLYSECAGGPEQYIGAWKGGEFPSMSTTLLTRDFEKAWCIEKRTQMGFVASDVLEPIFGETLESAYRAELAYLTGHGYMEKSDGGFALTNRVRASKEDQLFVAAFFYPLDFLRQAHDRFEKDRGARSSPGITHAPGDSRGVHPVLSQSDSAPLVVQLARTCNLRCVSCKWSDTFDGTFLDGDAFYGLIDSIVHSPRQHVHILGGDATIHPRFGKWLKKLSLAFKAANMEAKTLCLWTNGRRFSIAEYAIHITELGVNQFILSLHGADAETHDARTRLEGSFEQTRAGIGNLLQLTNATVKVRLVLDDRNIGSLGAAVRWLGELGVSRYLLDLTPGMELDCETVSIIHQLETTEGIELTLFRRKAMDQTAESLLQSMLPGPEPRVPGAGSR